MSADLHALRAFAEQLAIDAGALLLAAQPMDEQVQLKGPGDWFSALDASVELMMRERIATAYPEHGFLGEEGGASGATDRVWVVDPIDGSMNFLRGWPHYAVSLALVQDGEPVVACVLDPALGELFSAARGLGAHCNGRVLKVATPPTLMDAVAATVFPKPRAAFMPAYVAQLTRVLDALSGVRRSGSMALDLAYLAAGRVDVFWERGMGAWDAAAGVLLIREAGGKVFTLDNLPWMRSSHIAASTPGLSDAWRRLLAGA